MTEIDWNRSYFEKLSLHLSIVIIYLAQTNIIVCKNLKIDKIEGIFSATDNKYVVGMRYNFI